MLEDQRKAATCGADELLNRISFVGGSFFEPGGSLVGGSLVRLLRLVRTSKDSLQP